MNIQGHDIAVCSWSLQPKDTQDLITKVKQLGLDHVQIGLLPLVLLDDKRRLAEIGLLEKSGLTFTSGMMSFPGEDYSTIQAIHDTGGYVPDDTWETRKKLSKQAAVIAEELGITSIGTHVGFVPPTDHVDYPGVKTRVRKIAESFQSHGIDLLLETGQEPAEELLEFFKDLGVSNVGVNFDPANMILYGAGDPMQTIATLGKAIRHVHVKDATASATPGSEWGAEVPFGTGQVNPSQFLAALHAAGYQGPLAIEREAGEQRIADVRTAIDSLQRAAG